jgi:hypothetical protein
MKKTIIGLIEKIEINGQKFKAKIDTGATLSSMDSKIAARLKLGPIVRVSRVKSSHGRSLRPVVRASVKIKGRKIRASFNLTDRKEMKYDVLIGKNILNKGFLIDTGKR